VHRQVSAGAVHSPNRHSHLKGQQQRRDAGQKSQYKQPASKNLQHPCHGNEITRQAMLYKKPVHAVGVGKLRVPMPNKNDTKRQSQNQQSYGLKNI